MIFNWNICIWQTGGPDYIITSTNSYRLEQSCVRYQISQLLLTSLLSTYPTELRWAHWARAETLLQIVTLPNNPNSATQAKLIGSRPINWVNNQMIIHTSGLLSTKGFENVRKLSRVEHHECPNLRSSYPSWGQTIEDKDQRGERGRVHHIIQSFHLGALKALSGPILLFAWKIVFSKLSQAHILRLHLSKQLADQYVKIFVMCGLIENTLWRHIFIA